ncbi:hypothetical protein EKD16_13865 [Streptomonospora litoralis]|uniref:Uncharacterized protein n=1 Tax=Streptomonospora litoralis TaxID=2498135 RepID=A0A4P6Q1X7_9ACTN|nr:hypothetical protein EKD16_13865 [Streptomonospora litoralis]
MIGPTSPPASGSATRRTPMLPAPPAFTPAPAASAAAECGAALPRSCGRGRMGRVEGSETAGAAGGAVVRAAGGQGAHRGTAEDADAGAVCPGRHRSTAAREHRP